MIEQQPLVVLLDLTDIDEVDATGIAVLVGVGGDLKAAGTHVRVIVSDPRVLHRLPFTLGLRKVFTSINQALEYPPQSSNELVSTSHVTQPASRP